VIDIVERLVHLARRSVSRSRWVARLHDSIGLPVTRSEAPGVLIVQIDGLSEPRLRAAVAAGRMPFVARLLECGDLTVVPVYSGMPSTTPAVQAELFYGVEGAVPAFTFVDHTTGRLMRMYQGAAASAVEVALVDRSSGSLLAGGASYANVYAGGAADARFCMSSLGVGDVLPAHQRWRIPFLTVAYLPTLVRTAAMAFLELAAAPRDLVEGLRAGQDRSSELKFLVSRVAIGVVLRELTVFGMSVDLARGRKVVHGNLLGYDEHAHRRGPDSALADQALGAIDGAIARLWRAAHRSDARAYDVWIVSDHGQEATDSYCERYGVTVAVAIADVATELGIVAPDDRAWTDATETGVGRQRSRLLGERLIARVVPGLDVTDVHHAPGSLAVAAQGPVGHVYTPGPLGPAEADDLARAIVERAHVPMVLRRAGPGHAVAHTRTGTYELPEDGALLLGAAHPYLDAVSVDLAALCHHDDAGDLVISGWRVDGPSLSFPPERGAHAGPGPGETSAFALVPPDTPLAPADGRTVIRPGDLRTAAFARLRGVRAQPRSTSARPGLRVLTYNVHSCVGLDGRTSPERIARAIARHDPDVVALQELDVRRARTGHLDQAQAIADALEMTLTFHPTVSVADEQFGDAVLSRHRMRCVRTGALPGIGLEPRGAIWVEVEVPQPDGTVLRVQVLNTHLSLHPTERRLAVDALLGPDWLGHPDAAEGVVLCGDFNAVSWFPSFRRLRERLADTQTSLPGHAPVATWFGRHPVGRIDHVLVDPSWTVSRVQVGDDSLARIASDHRPLVVDVARDASSR
jgi:endonuclease/exonuclease/phosphatase family metal-dependent hydrolase